MPYLTLDDQRIHFSEYRHDLQNRRPDLQKIRPPLVLVHGAGGTLYQWPPALRRLADHNVYALDLPGHGKSAGPGRDSIGDYVEFVREWADALELPPFVLAGHSMGGGIAQTFAGRYPRRLRGMVLVATGARLRVHPDILNRVRTDKQGVGESLVEWVHGQRATPDQKRHYLRHFLSVDTEVMYGDWVACNGFDIMAQLPDIAVPALVIAGSRDQMTPPKFAQFLAEQLPDADLVMIEGGGHMLMLEQPGLLVSSIAGFLDRLRRG